MRDKPFSEEALPPPPVIVVVGTRDGAAPGVADGGTTAAAVGDCGSGGVCSSIEAGVVVDDVVVVRRRPLDALRPPPRCGPVGNTGNPAMSSANTDQIGRSYTSRKESHEFQFCSGFPKEV